MRRCSKKMSRHKFTKQTGESGTFFLKRKQYYSMYSSQVKSPHTSTSAPGQPWRVEGCPWQGGCTTANNCASPSLAGCFLHGVVPSKSYLSSKLSVQSAIRSTVKKEAPTNQPLVVMFDHRIHHRESTDRHHFTSRILIICLPVMVNSSREWYC